MKPMDAHYQPSWSDLGKGVAIATLIFSATSEIAARTLLSDWSQRLSEQIYQKDPNPSIGYRLKANYQGIAFGKPLRTNSLGFRGTEWSKEKTPGTKRIVLIGDSHAFGYGVSEQETLANRLQERLKQSTGATYEVLNFAVPGYNSIQENEVFQKVAFDYRPDFLLVLPCGNDDESTRIATDDGWLFVTSDPKKLHRVRDLSMENFRIQTFFPYQISAAFRFFANRIGLASLAPPRPTVTRAPASQYWSFDKTQVDPVAIHLQKLVYDPLFSLLGQAKRQKIPSLILDFNGTEDFQNLIRSISKETHVPVVQLFKAFPEAKSWEQYQELFSLGWDSHSSAEAIDRWAQFAIEKGREQNFPW